MPEEKDKFTKWVEKKADEEIEKSSVLFKRAQKRIPKEYHDFLILLKQTYKIASKKLSEVPTNLKYKGVYTTEGGTFISIYVPYFDAWGKIQMARDEHIKNNKTLYIKTAVNSSDHSEKMNLGHEVLIPPFGAIAVVESELKGISFGTAGISSGGFQEKQKEYTPKVFDIEKAETSAVARALTFLGYGIIGTAFIEEEEAEKKKEIEKKKEEEYKQKVAEFKALQTKKKISDGDLKKMAKEIGISKIATVDDLEALIGLMNKLPSSKKLKEKEEESPEEIA